MNARQRKWIAFAALFVAIFIGAASCIGKEDLKTGTKEPSTEATSEASQKSVTEDTSPSTTKETTEPTTEATTEPTTETTTAIATETTPKTTTEVATSQTSGSSTETPISKTVYAHGNVNIRSGPGTGHSKVKTVPSGTALTVVAQTGSWYRLSDDNYVSTTVVFDNLPTPSPTPDPNAPSLTQARAVAITKDIITSERSKNGYSTNFVPELNNACQKGAWDFDGWFLPQANNGSTNLGALVLQDNYSSENGWQVWEAVSSSGLYGEFDTPEEALRWIVRKVITSEKPQMISSSENTEFGVAVIRDVDNDYYDQVAYFIRISCASKSELQAQIDDGWYS